MSSAAVSNSEERDSVLSLSLTETQEDASKQSAQAAALKAATITPRGFRALSGNITPWKPDLSKCHVCGEDASCRLEFDRARAPVRDPIKFDPVFFFAFFCFTCIAAQTADFSALFFKTALPIWVQITCN